MKLKLGKHNDGHLAPSMDEQEKEYDLSNEEYTLFCKGIIKLYLNDDGSLRKEHNTELQNQIEGEERDLEKSTQINNVMGVPNKLEAVIKQINLTAGTLDVLVDIVAQTNPEILDHPWIIESKQKLNDIKNILNN